MDREGRQRIETSERHRKRSPQEEQALAAKPTEDLQAYDLYLRGKSYARRLTRQDLEFALQMLENAVAIDPKFALANAAIANVCAQYHYHYDRASKWLDRALAAAKRASELRHDIPEVQVAEAKAAVLALATTMILAVAASRVYFGVHWISDVAAGIGAGLLWVTVTTVAYETSRRIRMVRALRRERAMPG